MTNAAPAQASGSSGSDGRPVHSGLVLGLILVAQLMVVLDATIVNIALPKMERGLHFSPANLSWVVNGYFLAFGGFLLLGARCGDILGRRRVFIGGITVFTVASLLGGLAQSSDWLLAARAVQGVGAAFAAPSALALLMTMFEHGPARMKAIGWYTAVSIGGSAFGLLIGGLLTQFGSWRWVMFVNVPIGIVAVVVARSVLVETPPHRGRFDLAGALTSTVGVSALAYGFVRAASDGWGNPGVPLSFVVGVILVAAFVAVERRAAEPITPLRLFTNRDRNASYVARLLLVAGMNGQFFYLTQFMQDVLRYKPFQTGLGFLPLTVMLFASSQLSSRVLMERIPPKVLMVGGIALSTIGVLLLTRITQTSSYPHILAPLLMFGTGNGLAFVPLTSASLVGVAPDDAGAASGMVNVSQQLGGALGLSVIVTIFGSAASALAAGPVGAAAVHAADHRFVTGLDRAFFGAFVFLASTLVLLVVAIRGSHLGVAPDEEALAETLG